MNCDPVVITSVLNLRCEESILRQISQPVEDWTLVPEIVARLLRTLHSIEHANGISAVQIGIALRVAVVNVKRKPGHDLVLANPEIVSCSGRLVTRQEGCLSLPDFAAPIYRRNKVTLRAFDADGIAYTRVFKGYEAAVVQHEIDHMNGVLYWDRLPPGGQPQPRKNKCK